MESLGIDSYGAGTFIAKPPRTYDYNDPTRGWSPWSNTHQHDDSTRGWSSWLDIGPNDG